MPNDSNERTLQETLQTILEPNAEQLTATMLNRLGLIEIGRIHRVDDDGIHAIVDILSVQKKQVRCEIISIGCAENSMQKYEESQPVLVLYPCNAVTLDGYKINIANRPFNPKYAKCIPIGLNARGSVKLSALADSVHVTGTVYDAVFGKQNVQITNDDGFAVTVDCANNGVAIKADKTLVTIKESGVDVVVNGEWQYGQLVEGSGLQFKLSDGKVKIVGDLEVTGNLTAAGGNFEATV